MLLSHDDDVDDEAIRRVELFFVCVTINALREFESCEERVWDERAREEKLVDDGNSMGQE